jgi:hypothetical protein
MYILVELIFYFIFKFSFQKLSRQSKLSYGMVLEEVATRDVAGTICNQRRNRRSGKSNSTFVSTGVDHLAFLQMKITRSNLQPGETGLVGARDVFQVLILGPYSVD